MVTHNEEQRSAWRSPAITRGPRAASTLSLVDAYRNGDREVAAAEIYRCFVGDVARVVKWHLNNRYRSRVSVEDMVQEIFLDVFRRLDAPSFTPFAADQFAGWIQRVARNKTIKRIEYEEADKRSIASEVSGPESQRGDLGTYSGEADHKDALDRLIDRETVERGLARLPRQNQRIVRLLRRGYTQKEIGDELGVVPRTVSRRMVSVRRVFLDLVRNS